MLVFLCLALFVAAPLGAMLRQGRIVFDVLFTLLLISGVVTVAGRRSLTLAVVALTLVTLTLRWAVGYSDSSGLRPWSLALAIILLAVLTALVLVQVFREGPITSYRIQGAIVVYLLVGLMWSQAYEMVYQLAPGAFAFAHASAVEGLARHRLVYYSFVTMTTIGYGDITPVHPVARSLAMAEGLIGQLYPGILIARLVSMELESRRRK